MRSDWHFRPLGAVCEVLDHLRKPVTKKDRLPGPYPYYGATGIVDYVSDFLFDEPLVLVGEDGAKWASGDATAFAIEGPCWVNNHAHVLRPDRVTVLDEWLVHYLVHQDLSRYVSGLTVPKLNQGSLREIPIPLPALSEQRRIIAILDEAFGGIATAKAHAEKNLRNAREVQDTYVAALFSTAQDWTVGSLSSFVESISTGPFGSMLHKSDYVDAGVPLVNPINIVAGSIVPTKEKQVDGATAMRLRSYLLRSGDIVVGRRGEIGRCAVVSETQDGWLCGTGCFFIRPSSQIESSFIAHLIRSAPYRARLEALSTGATMQNLSNDALSGLEVALPGRAEQKRLLAAIDAVSFEADHLCEIYQRKLAALEELKQSLLHQAFSGQL